jgi:hypothetical protein
VDTDHYFKTWMTARLNESAFAALTITEVIAAAEIDLGLSVGTIKRLLIKHTGVHGEFCSDGVLVTMRSELA